MHERAGRGDRPQSAPAGGTADLLVGVNPILEQLRRDPGALRRLLVARGTHGGATRVAAAARRAGVAVEYADPERLRDLAPGLVHQGVVAWREEAPAVDWHDLLERRPACLLAADQVTDPRNLGALLRSAEATGVGGVVVPRNHSARLTPAVGKASAGAAALVPVARVVNLVRAFEELKRAGYWVVGLDGAAPQSVFDFVFPELCVVVVGGEGRGLRPLTRAHCDHLISIPMLGRITSLNVSTAAALALYERVRQAVRQPGVNGLTPQKSGDK